MSREAKNPEKEKVSVKANTFEIRTELGYTQKEFGKILGVSDRAIQNYESLQPEYSLPIEKAMLIHDKWDYSLDQIYLDFSRKNFFNKFNIDIRDFLSIEGESVVFSIPDYYWEYIREIKRINESDATPQEKIRLIKKQDSKYTGKTNSVIWRAEIPINDFLSFIKFGKDEIPFGSEEPETVYAEPTDEQLKMASDFLNEITKGDHK